LFLIYFTCIPLGDSTQALGIMPMLDLSIEI